MTFNTRILGGKISVFQSVSILGYCIFPLFFGMVMLKVLGMVGYKHILIKIFIMLVGALWGVLGTYFLIKPPRCSLPVTSKTPRRVWHSTPFCSSTCSSRCWPFTCDRCVYWLIISGFIEEIGDRWLDFMIVLS